MARIEGTQPAQSQQQPTLIAPGTGISRGVEVVRRALLLGGVLTAAWMLIWPAPALVRVGTVDFAELQKRRAHVLSDDLARARAMTGVDASEAGRRLAAQALNEFIASQTQDRLVVASGKAWDEFYESVAANLSGRSADLRVHLSHDTGRSYLYFATAVPPLAEVVPRLRQRDPFTYMRIDGPDGPKWLEVLYQRPPDAARYAPAWLMYPQRQYAVWAFIIGLLGYALLPWAKVPAVAVVCSRVRSVVLPDLLGLAMAAVFFSLPILILTHEGSSSDDFALLSFDRGWAWLTIILWAFAAGGVSIMVVALWYATFAVLILPDRLRRVRLLGQEEWPYADMLGVEPAHWAPPGWLKALFILGAILKPRHAGAMILGATSEAWGIRIPCRDGRALTLWLQGMPACERIFGALKRGGVPMDAELSRIVEEETGEDPKEAPPRSRLGRVIGIILVLLTITVALWLHFRPARQAELAKPSREVSVEAVQKRQSILREMQGVQAEMQSLVARLQTATGDQRDMLARQHAALMARFDELNKQFESISIYEDMQNGGATERP